MTLFSGKFRKAGWTWLLLFCSGATHIFAEVPGISEEQIKIGSCSALEGPARQLGLESILGATAYFDYVNDHGGVNGRKLVLRSFDDGYDPGNAGTCFASLRRENVFAAGFFVGTPTAARYVPLAEAAHLPIVGWFTGAEFLYEPVKHEIFSLRGSYNDETRAQVDGLWKAGVRKISVIYQDDDFGKAIVEGVRRALTRHKATPSIAGSFVRNTLAVQKAVEAARAGTPDAVILAGPYAPVAEILKRAHAEGWHPLFVAVSFVGTQALINAAGRDAEGVVITQVVPTYYKTDLPAVRLYRDCLTNYMSATQPSFVSLEAFIDAMVMVEGLQRAGKEPTREKFIEAIESMNDVDIGLGPTAHIQFGPRDHKGLGRVYPTVVRDGEPEVFSDWTTVLKH
jgi:ABC-type branched-subunit amino acid transport system substrate-binding protein